MAIIHQPADRVRSRGCGRRVEQVLTILLANRQEPVVKGWQQKDRLKDRNPEMSNYFSLFSSKMRNAGPKNIFFSKLP